MKKYISYSEIAEHLGIPLRTLYYYKQEGKMPTTYRIGKHYRVHFNDYTEWLRKLK